MINKKNNLSFIIIITLYSIIMTIFSLSVQTDLELIKNLIIIPISLQMLHFYIDSRLWRFSEPHNRLVVLDFLKKQPN